MHPSFPQLTPKVLASITSLATGDARTALSLLELVLVAPKDSEESNLLSSLRRSVSASYARDGDSHYDMISALHKSVRGSQGSAAMYWLARMLAGGEDPLYIVRRMIVCASEDIGLADNHALPLVSAGRQLSRQAAGFILLGHSYSSCLSNSRYARMSNKSCTSSSVPFRGAEIDAVIRRLQASRRRG